MPHLPVLNIIIVPELGPGPSGCLCLSWGDDEERKCERVAKESQGMNESGRGKESCV